ncbi:longevity assurance proteins LAG1 LAC1 [Panus rudis PR-1116 ss-1]|nr:longevity assurance proteins LAG1 LAC1 [Panus rudis PR-1116 ss-1]
MAGQNGVKQRRRAGTISKIETDPSHHLAGPFGPQTPLDQQSSRPSSPAPWNAKNKTPNPWSTESRGLWQDIKSLRWVVVPTSSLKLLLIPIALWANWELLAPYVGRGLPNPFAPLLFISHRVPDSSPDDPRYQKGWLDLVFIAYYIIFWSFVRQIITLHMLRPIAKWFGVKKSAKLDRFGEQGYATIYFAVMACWGLRIMSQLPTWWYRTEYFWIGNSAFIFEILFPAHFASSPDYPHWQMTPELKRYYLMQSAYWVQQLMVLVLGLEKPRKDYYELVAHHLVTLWLVGWSYLINLTIIGNAVYLSMDLPDVLLGFTKMLNYIQYDKTKIASFMVLVGTWTYFRHYLNLRILYSVWTEFDLMPETSKRWSPSDGVWMVWWMKYQVFTPILLLQFLNLFWYYLILRILVRAVTDIKATDVRSDDEDDDEPDAVEDSKKD